MSLWSFRSKRTLLGHIVNTCRLFLKCSYENMQKCYFTYSMSKRWITLFSYKSNIFIKFIFPQKFSNFTSKTLTESPYYISSSVPESWSLSISSPGSGMIYLSLENPDSNFCLLFTHRNVNNDRCLSKYRKHCHSDKVKI